MRHPVCKGDGVPLFSLLNGEPVRKGFNFDPLDRYKHRVRLLYKVRGLGGSTIEHFDIDGGDEIRRITYRGEIWWELALTIKEIRRLYA